MVMTYEQEVLFENLKHDHRKDILAIEHKNTMEELAVQLQIAKEMSK